MIFSWRELRKVTKALTLHYERKLYLLADTPENRRLIGKYIESEHRIIESTVHSKVRVWRRRGAVTWDRRVGLCVRVIVHIRRAQRTR